MSDPQVFAGLLQMPYPSVEAWRKRLEDRLDQQDGLHLVAVDGDDVIASGGIHGFGPVLRRRHAAHLGICVALERQQQGIGSEMMRRLCEWADNWAGYLRIELTVYTDNDRAIALYRRFGFVIEGTHRAHAMRDGVYVDIYAMARFHPDPPKPPQSGEGE
jgi:putative acetyltransferase